MLCTNETHLSVPIQVLIYHTCYFTCLTLYFKDITIQSFQMMIMLSKIQMNFILGIIRWHVWVWQSNKKTDFFNTHILSLAFSKCGYLQHTHLLTLYMYCHAWKHLKRFNTWLTVMGGKICTRQFLWYKKADQHGYMLTLTFKFFSSLGDSSILFLSHTHRPMSNHQSLFLSKCWVLQSS
jgi:hypothetical protein